MTSHAFRTLRVFSPSVTRPSCLLFAQESRMNIAEQILALDARYNAYRAPENPQYRTLYIRRRIQLLRENAKRQDVDQTCRGQYLYLRRQLLSKRYGPSELSSLSRSRSASTYSKLSSFEASFDSLHVDQPEGGHSPMKSGHRRFHSAGSFKFLPSVEKTESLPMGVVPTNKAEASRRMAGNTSLSENYAFAGMYHIFDQHTEPVTAIKFANDDKFRLAFSSADGKLSVCVLTPNPSVQSTLRGHEAPVLDFNWSITNGFILSASMDGTARVWDPSSGACLRVVVDNHSCGVTACRFHPCNNNMFVTGNQRGHLSVYNTSTGKGFKGGTAKLSSAVKCVEIDSSGTILWVGDEKGCITSFCFDIASGRLHKAKRFAVSDQGSAVTSISYRSWVSREARNPMLLANVASNLLCLFRVVDDLGGIKLMRSFGVVHKTCDLRSSFCPLMSFRQGACVVTGSEDMAVYFFDVEKADRPCVNKLMGHSAPVLDVCWNYDESLLASCDTEGTVIVWQREQPKVTV